MTSYIRTKPEPYCPACGAKMVLRRPKSHQNFDVFWGCSQYPDCKGSREVAEVNEDQLSFVPPRDADAD